MREKNATSIEYFKDPRRIVDLLNGMVFHGRQVITEDNLLEKNPVLHNVYRENRFVDFCKERMTKRLYGSM